MFEGKTKLQQQRMVNEVISEEIKNIHGYSLKTKPPKKHEPEPEPDQELKDSEEKQK